MARGIALAASLSLAFLGSALLPVACGSKEKAESGNDTPATGPSCPDDAAFFQSALWRPLMSDVCITCHNAEGLAKNSGMVLVSGDSSDTLAANLETVRRVARVTVDGTSILVLKPSGKFPGGHTGGDLVKEGSAVYASLRAFAARASGEPGACGPSDGGAGRSDGFVARKLRRLTRFEYDNTVSDLFGISSTFGKSLPPDDVVDGFDNNAASLVVGSLFADKARTAAEDIAEEASSKLATLVPCVGTAGGVGSPAEGVAACAREFIDTFGERALRRPLEAAERERYTALYASVAADEGFTEGLESVVAAMLQSPYFLYRLELGGAPHEGVVTLTDHEIASELSYLLIGSAPDAELRTLARAGKLHEAADIRAQAARLLASAESRRVLDHFVAEWLDLDRLAQVPKDEALYPEFTAGIRAAMRAETTEFFDALVHGGGSFPDLFRADYSYMSEDLARFYGLGAPSGPASSSGLPRYTVGAERGGVLTHGSVLATQAKNNSSSPIHRGKLVRERLLCQKLPPPPAGLNVQLPKVDPLLSNRERFTAHDQNEACSSCHKLMDPIGFGFEAFDAVGHLQTVDHGKPVVTSGEILQSPRTSGKFDGVRDLENRLSESDDVRACFALEWARFAYGESGDADESAAVEHTLSAFAAAQYRLDELLVASTGVTRFTTRAAGPSAEPPVVAKAPEGGTPMSPGNGSGGAGGAGAGGASGRGGSAGAPATTSGFVVDRVRNSDWSTGYCEQITVTNGGAAAGDWTLSLPVEGTLTQSWNCLMAAAANGAFNVTGADFNRHLEAGASAGFGFCASK